MAAKDPSSQEQYSGVVQRLQALVEQLEGGGLSLEDSLEKFAEGIQLVRKGEKLLSEAEKRIEQLLSDDGGARVAPLDIKESATEAPGKRTSPAPATARRPLDSEEDDVPF